MVYISDEKLKNLPFGPLEKDVHDNLSNSALDASRTVAHAVAVERGVVFGEASRARFAEKLAERATREVYPIQTFHRMTDIDEVSPTSGSNPENLEDDIDEQRRRISKYFAEHGHEEEEEEPEEE